MNQRLNIKHSQSIVMTPQLRQAIKLLQFSNLELSSYIDEEIEKNPFLDRKNNESVLEGLKESIQQKNNNDHDLDSEKSWEENYKIKNNNFQYDEISNFEDVSPFLNKHGCDAAAVFGQAVTTETHDAFAAYLCYAI